VKKDSRFIPQSVFQVIALLVLAMCLTLTVYWIVNDTGLYRVLRNVFNYKTLAMLSTFLVVFAGWLMVVVPIRMISKIPTIKEELGVGIQDGLREILEGMKHVFREESSKNEEMYRAQEYSEKMKHRARQLGQAFLIAGVLLTLAGVLMFVLVLETGRVFMVQIMIMLSGPAFIIVGLIQIVTGKSVL